MKNDINLLGPHDTKAQNSKGMFFTVSVLIFAFFFMISVLILLFSFLQKSKLSQLNNNINDLSAKMSVLSSEKDKMLTVTNRLTTIKKIINTRKAIDAKIQAIISLIPNSFNINDFSASDTKLGVTMTSESLADFDNFLENTVPELTKNKSLAINHIDMGSFTSDQGNYTLTTTFYFTPASK